MLNLKKLLTIISNALYVGNDEYTPTYSTNNYYSTTAVNRLRVYRTGPRSGLVRINLTNDVAAIPSTDTTEQEIASFSGVSFARDAYLVLPSQNVGANIAKNTFFRLTVPVVLNLDTGGVIPELIHRIRMAYRSLRKEVMSC